MSCSRAALSAAAISCALHIVLLGLAAAVLISAAQFHQPALTVAVYQPAAPLPVEGSPTPAATASGPVPGTASAVSPRLAPLDATRRPRAAQTRPEIAASREADIPQAEALLPPPQLLSRLVTPSPLPEEHAPPPGLTLPPLAGVEQHGAALATHRFLQSERSGAHSRGPSHGPDASLSAQPQYGVNPKPPYPFLARRAGIQGVVRLRVRVRADGTVAEVVLFQSSGFSLLDDAALQTVRERWRFVPAQQEGKPVESWVEVPAL